MPVLWVVNPLLVPVLWVVNPLLVPVLWFRQPHRNGWIFSSELQCGLLSPAVPGAGGSWGHPVLSCKLPRSIKAARW